MSMAQTRAAFQEGLGESGRCQSARHDYLDGGRFYRLTFKVERGGAVSEVTCKFAAAQDTIEAARQMGLNFSGGQHD